MDWYALLKFSVVKQVICLPITWRTQALYALLKPERHFVPLSWKAVHAKSLRMCTNVVDFKLCEDCTVANEINYEIDYAWTSIHDNGHMVTACDVWLQ